MKVLIVTSDFPYPPDHGGRVDMWERIIILSKMELEIDLIATTHILPTKQALATVREYVHDLKISHRQLSLTKMFSFLPFQCTSRNTLTEIPLISKYDALLLESEYVYPILNNPSLKTKKILLRIQNNEPAYFKELSRSSQSFAMKIYYSLEAIKMAHLDKSLFPKADALLFISFDEWSESLSCFPPNKSFFLPPPVEMSFEGKTQRECSEKVLFVGSLFMPNNREAITWYIENVHSLIETPNYQFIIAGNSRGLSINWLQDLASPYSNIVIYNTPSDKDLVDIYAKSCVFVNPMQHGAGVNIKTINAIKYSLPIVSTTTGCQGTGLQTDIHILIENNAIEFSKKIQMLFQNSDKRNVLIQNSQLFLHEKYKHSKTLRLVFDSIIG